eukprot:TRINITY_DN5740_c0_g1_i1.p1 TRINITY_DN5740_c0_g1~~TRINITY_DN5740_c0_g1_i1.p1  ORF type:complete len:330 (-),score=30.69 TRINITY_DN5740_c0_g1_i1:1040-2029(-)
MNHVTSENMYFLRHRDFEDFVNFGRFGSFYHQISSIYPEFILHPWKFGKCEDRFWSVEKNQSLYLSWLGRILGYRTFNDWYAITTGLISQNFGCSLLRLHNNSCYLTLKKTMPYFGWCPWKFSCTFKNFWLDSQNLRIFYENLAEEMNIQVMEDWYSFNMQIFVVPNPGPHVVLKALYPTYMWTAWKFVKSPKKFWSFRNQRHAMDSLGLRLGIKMMSEWYVKCNQKNITSLLGYGLLSLYKGSPQDLLKSVYPEFNWRMYLFNHKRGTLEDKTELSELIRQIQHQLQISSLEDWYRVSYQQISDLGNKLKINNYVKFFSIIWLMWVPP